MSKRDGNQFQAVNHFIAIFKVAAHELQPPGNNHRVELVSEGVAVVGGGGVTQGVEIKWRPLPPSLRKQEG